uniref:NADH dehydrogenase subunit 3 n=1 Tax=Ixodes woyliei TaxID=1933095 RepID=UPI001FF4048D|nr:NADH dehydrogenase subunit 3 [Ixodes woyliei]UOK09767.1 NADH dehydrogenase subunit 3 [Ixodes woyliei]
MKTLTIFLIPIIIMMTSLFISKKKFMDKEKLSPFECGFDPMSMSRSSFSLKFFMISIIFLIFDIEIVLILPFPMINNKNLSLYISLILIMTIILLGLMYEWKKGMLEWMK